MKNTFLLLFFVLSTTCFSQVDSIDYSRDYEFSEGFYLTMQDFIANNPISKSAIISSIPSNQIDFMSQVLEAKYVYFKNMQGVQRKVNTDSIWGYSQNNAIYINFAEDFQRVSVIGSIFHFLANVFTTPAFMGGQDPLDSNFGLNSRTEEVKQFIFDVKTNKVFDFNVKNMTIILSRDKELYDEFMKLSNRKKSETVFVYLRKYNTKHPLKLSAIK